MAVVHRSRGRRGRRSLHVQKPRGTLHPRVQAVGPEHFGIVCVDCHKARSQWMLSDFYGKVLVAPREVAHWRPDLEAALQLLRAALRQHGIQDVIVALERTGNYHQPVRRAFAAAGYETRLVHPYATKQFRQPANPGNKTDETDLAAIQRAAANGFGLLEAPRDSFWRRLRLLVRHRRDLVGKCSALQCQIREHLTSAMPGYAECFGSQFWNHNVALLIARQTGSAAAVRQASADGLARMVQAAGVRYQQRSLEKVLAWAQLAAEADPDADFLRPIWTSLDDDRLSKALQIQALERQLAGLLAQTPYVLLLTFPGINVVSAAELAGEMGPIGHYANAKAITGRAGLFPTRYQSARVDNCNGPLVRCANHSLRAALLLVADNLSSCNRHFRALAEVWKAAGKDPRATRVKIAARFSRIAYQIVAGRQVFRHPSARRRDYLLEKLLAFHRQHDTGMSPTLADLQAALEQLPGQEYGPEALPLERELKKTRSARCRGSKAIGQILPIVLAKLGVGQVQSEAAGDQDPD